MQTRRQILQQALSFPFVASPRSKNEDAGCQLICGSDCLSGESAQGFRLILAGLQTPKLIIVCGANAMTRDRALRLREQALGGTWTVWESSPLGHMPEQKRIAIEIFGIPVRDSLMLPASHMYVRYSWPHPALTRSFLSSVPLACPANEAIALCGDTPVASKRRIGRGGIVFLGSMLGPNIRAEEREARQIATEMFRLLA